MMTIRRKMSRVEGKRSKSAISEHFLSTHMFHFSGHKLRSFETIFELIAAMDSGFKLLQIVTKFDAWKSVPIEWIESVWMWTTLRLISLEVHFIETNQKRYQNILDDTFEKTDHFSWTNCWIGSYNSYITRTKLTESLISSLT